MANKQNASTTVKKRKLELPKRRWYAPKTWRRNLPIPPRKPLSSTVSLLGKSFRMLKKDWRPYLAITVVYIFGLLVFVKSFSVGSIDRELADAASGQGLGVKLSAAATQVSGLVQNATASISAASGVYQIIITTIISLAFIFAFRIALSHEKPTAKKSLYSGMTPLVPYLLVLLMLGLHLIPIAIGAYLFSLAIGLLYGAEVVLAVIGLLLFLWWTMFLLSHSIFALIIVTLPDMTPLKALRSAKQLVFKRRLLIWRKIILAALMIALAAVLLLAVFVLWIPQFASWAYFLFSVIILPLYHAFTYTLYREML